MWCVWRDFWDDFVPEATRGDQYSLIINGDSVDGRHHKSTTQVSQNLADQFKIAHAIVRPLVENPLCSKLFWIVGTEAHVGESGESEELLALSLGAIPSTTNQYVRQTMWGFVGGEKDGCLCHFAHHIGTTGSSHYEASAINKELTEHFAEAGRWNSRAPDIVVRSHRHRCAEFRMPTSRGYGISVVTPGWQGKTPFITKIPGGRQAVPQIGGLVIRQGRHDHYTRTFVKCMPREKEEIL